MAFTISNIYTANAMHMADTAHTAAKIHTATQILVLKHSGFYALRLEYINEHTASKIHMTMRLPLPENAFSYFKNHILANNSTINGPINNMFYLVGVKYEVTSLRKCNFT